MRFRIALELHFHQGLQDDVDEKQRVGESAAGGEREETVGESSRAILEIKTGPTQRHTAHFDKHKQNGSQGREGNDATFTFKLLKAAENPGICKRRRVGTGKMLHVCTTVAKPCCRTGSFLEGFFGMTGIYAGLSAVTLTHLHRFVCTRGCVRTL